MAVSPAWVRPKRASSRPTPSEAAKGSGPKLLTNGADNSVPGVASQSDSVPVPTTGAMLIEPLSETSTRSVLTASRRVWSEFGSTGGSSGTGSVSGSSACPGRISSARAAYAERGCAAADDHRVYNKAGASHQKTPLRNAGLPVRQEGAQTSVTFDRARTPRRRDRTARGPLRGSPPAAACPGGNRRCGTGARHPPA